MGAYTTVLVGVVIGDNAVVAAGTVMIKNVPAKALNDFAESVRGRGQQERSSGEWASTVLQLWRTYCFS